LQDLQSLIQPQTAEAISLLAKFFRGLSDATRLRILYHLLEKERNVSELVELLGISQGRVSNHLACLKWCGYVNARQDEQDGRYIYYQVVDPRVREIVKLGWEMMSDNAEQIASCTRIQAK